MTDTHLSDVKFASLNLPPVLLQGIEEAGFSLCTPIQAETLPVALAGRDIAGQAQTGTGKTAAFLVATYNRLLTSEPPPGRRPTQPRAVMIAPTRELAIQIHKDAVELGKYTGFRLGLVYGGAGYDSQRRTLEEGVDILIGTPGRMIDYFKQHIFDLKAVQVAVMDEADRMFDLGFIKDIRYLLRRMPKPEERLSLLFSATLSLRVTELAYEHMNNPEHVVIDADQRTAERVRQLVYYPGNEEKIPLLLGLLRSMDVSRVLIFTNMKRTAENVGAYLDGNGYEDAVLSGDVPQNKRLSLLKRFTAGELPILIATDVAARGLHIPEVSHVINYDLPQDPEDYVHRIGRTARAGAEGDAISFACEDSAFALPDIEAYIGHSIAVAQFTPAMLVEPKPPIRKPRKKRPGPGSGRPRGDKGGGRGRRRGPPGERGRAKPS
ncbi:MAG: ATP-dependent RNA helicase RhlB [Pseudomonadota bacterium]|nr:MAG: ATP-dependent RNA helicase RhlB [Pseudomonadota bacterium]